MKIRGVVFSGVLRGQPLIELYYPRLVGLLDFHPYRGTMDVKLERTIDMRRYSTKAIEHVLMDGRKVVNALLAPVVLTHSGQHYKCWAMQQQEGLYEEDIVEIIAEERLKDKLGIEDGNVVELEFFETEKKSRKPNIIEKLKPKREVTLGKRK